MSNRGGMPRFPGIPNGNGVPDLGALQRIKSIAPVPHPLPYAEPVYVAVPSDKDPTRLIVHIYGGMSPVSKLAAEIVGQLAARNDDDQAVVDRAVELAARILIRDPLAGPLMQNLVPELKIVDEPMAHDQPTQQ